MPILNRTDTVRYSRTWRNAIQIWRIERNRVVRERTLKPAEKWYEADVSWRDAATLAIEYSVAAPRRRRPVATRSAAR